MEKYTKFEQARIVGSRALQISQGAPINVKLTEEDFQKMGYDPVDIALMEFKLGLIAIDVRRPLPGRHHGNSRPKAFDQTKLE
jgi:DNA-directed RNA polymerase subunit K/omega